MKITQLKTNHLTDDIPGIPYHDKLAVDVPEDVMVYSWYEKTNLKEIILKQEKRRAAWYMQ